MEKQYVKINLDNYLSHRPGLLPYVPYNETYNGPIPSEAPNGNWKQFVCDLQYGDVVVPYNETMRRFNESEKILSRGVIAKKTDKTLAQSEPKCNGTTPITRYKECLTTKFDDVITEYNYKVADISWFVKELNLYWPITAEGRAVLEDYGMVILIDDYETVMANDEWWVSNYEPLIVDYVGQSYDGLNLSYDVSKYFLGRIAVPEVYDGSPLTGIKVPNHINLLDVPRLIEWFTDHADSDDATIREEYEKRGGDLFLEFLREQEELITDGDFRIHTPDAYVPSSLLVPTTLISEEEYCGLYETYEPSAEEYSDEAYGVTGITTSITLTNAFIESQLDEVMDDDAVVVGDIIGVPEKCGEIYKATLLSGPLETIMEDVGAIIVVVEQKMVEGEIEYRWWRFTKEDNAPTKAYETDGELRTDRYQPILTFDSIKSVIDYRTLDDDMWGWFMIKKHYGALMVGENHEYEVYKPVKIPFTEGSIHNPKEIDTDIYICDYISAITENDDDTLTIDYVLGGTFDKIGDGDDNGFEYRVHTGTLCEETFDYYKAKKMMVIVDGEEKITAYCDVLDMDAKKVDVSNDEYGLTRKGNLSQVLEMEVGTMFNGETTIIAPVFTREGTSTFMEDPKKILNITIDRGVGAAFERHFKLSECNSFEDLENYGNNYYNI